jgi:hypothetical protein
MKNERVVEEIIDQYAPDLLTGQVSVDSILEKHPQYAGELREEMEAIQWLGKAKLSLATRPGYINDSRKYLEAKIASTAPLNSWQRLFRRYSPQHMAFYITAPALVIVLMVMIINSLVLTARLSLPGEALYSTKLFMEDARLALTFDPAKRTELNIEYTRQRTSEFVELVLDGDYGVLPSAANRLETELIASLHALDELNRQNPYEAQPMAAELRETLTNELSMLDLLRGSTPPSATSGIDLVINVAQSGLMALR